MDRRKRHRPKGRAKAGAGGSAKAAAAKDRHIRPSARTQDSGRVTWRPSWAGKTKRKP